MTWYEYWFQTPVRELAACHQSVWLGLLFFASFGAMCLFALAIYFCMEIKDWVAGGSET